MPLEKDLAEVTFEPREDMLGFHRNVQVKSISRQSLFGRAPYFFCSQVVVYAFVTARARLTMLKDMRWLMSRGCSIFYTDTDSIIFSCPSQRVKEEIIAGLKLGSAAYGAYKFETKTPLIKFVALGPKNYAYETQDGETTVKTRGFTLSNAAALNEVNLPAMQAMLTDHLRGLKSVKAVRGKNIRVKRSTHTVHTVNTTKTYRNDIFDKRNLDTRSDGRRFETIPWGAANDDYQDGKIIILPSCFE